MPQPNPFSLAGKRALITGSTRGIGLELARGLAEAGASVVINGRDQRGVSETVASLSAEGLACEGFVFDITQPDAKQFEERLGPIDILVNNAGIHRRHHLLGMSLAEWQSVIDVNLTGAFLVSRLVVPGMIARRGGKIVNVCSLMSEIARPTTGNYAAAKGGLKMLTKTMCAEWAQDNIQVNGIAPGYILTDLTRPLANDENFSAWIKGRTPAGRWGTPRDLVGACVFLSSPAADFVNGHLLTVDGGLTAVI